MEDKGGHKNLPEKENMPRIQKMQTKSCFWHLYGAWIVLKTSSGPADYRAVQGFRFDLRAMLVFS